MTGVREGKAAIPGGELWYWDTGGDGPPVVLLHSGTGSALSWPGQQTAFAEAGYRVIGYSRRGHYRSSAPPPEVPGSGADDLAALASALELGPFHAVAVAAGGIYAADFALGHPAALRSLVIAGSVMGITDADWQARLDALQFPGFRGLPHDFLELGPSYRAENPDGLTEWRRIHELAYNGGEMVIQHVTNDITWATLGRLAPPVLLIAGGADLYVPPPAMREVAAHIPGAQLVVMPDVGHSAPWERPEEFNRAVLGFLGRVEAART
ncbi:alpha/beta fold hydrolase [Amycolatopsis pithecellobii]|uniref:Alpha/beta fold hydrolase n=1 Tax=Amycolatopsis pithecellobii TaxID=664692 RepID=A0A6N7YJG5_9PSEU|nr:alpha/beta hydrolase [Amycolatopsis pithecellobii]MTD53037.1 alpha/beta fold hydrolase [Amycolatopsis pithecellobii]